MSEHKTTRESREDALERILAETANNPYNPAKRKEPPTNRSGVSKSAAVSYTHLTLPTKLEV